VIGIAVFGAAGELFARHGERRFHAASTIKVPIMIEAYRQIESGLLDPDDTHILRDDDRVPGSGVLSHLHAGLELTVRDLVTLMIIVSDNTATNLVLDRIGLDAVNATMQSLGIRDSILGRPMLGRLPKEGEPENWATPRDFARCVQAIVDSKAADAESCAQMMETLQQQTESRRISRFLELAGGAGTSWGTKPGDLPGVFNDVGFVTTERGTLSMAIFCEHVPDLDFAERAIGEISRQALAVTGIVSAGLTG
jgi:beta-lactamase class A